MAEYALDLARTGTRVVPGSPGTFWVGYESGAIVRMPTFHLAPPAPGELRDIFWKTHAPVVGYVLEPDESRPANAWLYICTDRAYALDKLGPATRRNIRRGLRELVIRPLTAEQLLVHGVQAFCDTRRRVGLTDGTAEEFRRQFMLRARCPGHVFVGAWKENKLAAFLSITEVDDWAETTCFSTDALLQLRPNDALFFYALSHYLTERAFRLVSYGLSSVQAESNGTGLHAFKTKIGFEAQPVHRAFVIHPLLRPFGNRLTRWCLDLVLKFNPGNRRLRKAAGVLAYVLRDKSYVRFGRKENER